MSPVRPGSDRLERLGCLCLSDRYSGLEKDGCSPARRCPALVGFPVGVHRGRVPMDRSRSGQGPLDRIGLDLPHAHVVGIDGRDMVGLAQNLVQTGMAVTGSAFDSSKTPASSRSLVGRIVAHPARRAITARTRLLVHRPEVDRCHSARLTALRRGICQETPASWLRARMQGRHGIAVAGGREASAAAAMIGLALEGANLDPSVVLGTAAAQLGGWSREGMGPHFVAEWSGEAEAYAIFRPNIAVLLNVGSDPWIDLERWSETLRRSLRALPEEGFVLALGHPSLLDGLPDPEGGPGRFQWISLQRGADWWGADLREESGRFRFRVFHQGRYVIEIRLQVPGRRAVLAALAAVATCDRLGISVSAIRQGIEGFQGLSRDFESRGSFRGVTLMDDEADGAASIRDVLGLARRSFGARRIWAVYATAGTREPRRLAAAFSDADRVLVIERQATDHRPPTLVSPSRILTHTLTDAGIMARRSSNLVEAISELDRHLEPGDVLLTLGAGDVGTIADAFIRRLSRDRQDG